MLRVTTWHVNPNASPDTTPAAAIQAFNEFVAACGRVRGAGSVRWFFGNGGIVTVGEPENYAVADAILADRGVQATGAKVLSLGYDIAQDLFLTDLKQVSTFIPQA
jgi:hypothetical protein